jgi:hypothetical protein
MLFLQLSLLKDGLSFQHPEWIASVKSRYPNSDYMDLDNHSDLYLFQQVLKWILDKKEPLILHIHSFDTHAETGNIFRFLQEVFAKHKPLLITLQGEHEGLKKYIQTFAVIEEVDSVEEALGLVEGIGS